MGKALFYFGVLFCALNALTISGKDPIPVIPQNIPPRPSNPVARYLNTLDALADADEHAHEAQPLLRPVVQRPQRFILTDEQRRTLIALLLSFINF